MAREKDLTELTQSTGTIVTTAYGEAVDVSALQTFAAECNVTVNTPGAKTFTADATTDTMTATAHGFTTGLKGQASNSGGALPTGLSGSTDYFVIVVTANTFKLATSLANATATPAVPIDITTNGTGTQTFTPTSLAGATVKLQKTLTPSDSSSWVDEGNATNITQSGYVYLEKVDPTAKSMRLAFTLTAGALTSTNQILGKGLDG